MVTPTPAPATNQDVAAMMEKWVQEDLSCWSPGIFPTLRFMSLICGRAEIGTTTIVDLPSKLKSESFSILAATFTALVRKHNACAGAMALSVLAKNGPPLYLRWHFAVPMEVILDPDHPRRNDNLQFVFEHARVTREGTRVFLQRTSVKEDHVMEILLPRKH